MREKLTAILCALSMLCATAVYARDIDADEGIVPEFDLTLNGEPMEEITTEDNMGESEECQTSDVLETNAEEQESEPLDNETNADIENTDNRDETGDAPTEDVNQIIEITTEDESEEMQSEATDSAEEVTAEEITEPYFYETEPISEVYDVSVDVNTEIKTVEIDIVGINLKGRLVSIKISPLGGYGEIYYVRTLKFDGDMLTVCAKLSDEISGLCSVDIDMAEIGHWHKVTVVGESSNLTCVSNRKTATISGICNTSGIKSVQIKVFDETGRIVFLRQKNSNADGSFELKAILPAESGKYMVWMTVSGESGGYAKTITPFNPTEAKYTYEFTSSANIGEYVDVAVYAKNITDKKKYVYELDYSKSADDLTLTDACALNESKVLSRGVCQNTDVEIISISDGKIRFVINGETEANKLWSGLLNLIRFKSNANGNVIFTLRIFE